MEGLSGAFAFLGVGAIITLVVGIFLSVFSIVFAIILLCLAVKEKGELKLYGVDEARIRKIVTLSILSLVVTIISCSGCAFLVLPILALAFANSNSKSALQAGNMLEALKKADLALLMIIISNVVILAISALSTFMNIITSVLETL